MRIHLLRFFDRPPRVRVGALLALSALAGGLSALMVPLVVWGIEHRFASALYGWTAAGYVVALGAVLWLRRAVPT
ncbi:MAG: hypothetical protein AAGC55_28995, partial [Myxococcota bacterium]